MATSIPPSPNEEKSAFDLNLQHGHKDLVQAVAFNTYGDRCATGSVDGKIRVFNRHKDGTWRLCDTWAAHGGEILEVIHTIATLTHLFRHPLHSGAAYMDRCLCCRLFCGILVVCAHH